MGRPEVASLALLVVVLYAAGWVRAAEAQWTPWTFTCDTSTNSPTKADIMAATSFNDNDRDEECCQSNLLGSKCTTLFSQGTAIIAWCNTDGLRCQGCKGIMSNIQAQLVDYCAVTFDDGVERVGGDLHVNGDSGLGNILLLRN